MPFNSRTLQSLGAGLLALCAPALLHAKLRVVASLPVYGDLARQVGGADVHVDVVAKELQDPHFIQPTPWSIARVSRADVYLTTGLDLELWTQPLLEAGANARVFQGSQGFLPLAKGLKVLQIPQAWVTRQAGDIHGFGNPHFYYDPDSVLELTRSIEAKFSELDPSHAAEFRARGEAYRGRLEAKIQEWRKLLAPFRGQKVVPFHNSFPYFERFSGLVVPDHIEPKPGINPSASHLARLSMLIKREGIRVILHEPWYNQKFSNAVARRTGAKVVMFYSQPGPKGGGVDFLTMMDGNIQRLVEVLQGDS